MDNAEALERLGRIADAFLLHDRPIRSRYDDSVFRVVDGAVEPVRRARGYAPFPLALPFESDVDILAVGPEQKNTFTLLKGAYAFVSQHIGDMENAETLASFEQTIELYERLFRITPEDRRPRPAPRVPVHQVRDGTRPAEGRRAAPPRAHRERDCRTRDRRERVTGVAFDGTGYGTDGHIWGGEVLLADWAGFERFAHLAYVPMPGGAAAIRRPARMAIGALAGLGLLDHPGAGPLRSRLAEGEETLLLRMIERGVNSPLTSSMGRLFDAVAAIVGVRDDARYEGEAAIELEAAADPAAEGGYEFALRAVERPRGHRRRRDGTSCGARHRPDRAAGVRAGRPRRRGPGRRHLDSLPPRSCALYSRLRAGDGRRDRYPPGRTRRWRVHESARPGRGSPRTPEVRADAAHAPEASGERRRRIARTGCRGLGKTARDLMRGIRPEAHADLGGR